MALTQAIVESALSEADDALLTQIKELDTVEDVRKFWGDFHNGTLVEEQVKLTSFYKQCPAIDCVRGYVVKKSNNVTSFLRHIPKDLCEQYIHTQLILELKQTSHRDYTEVNSSTDWVSPLTEPCLDFCRKGTIQDV